MCKDSPRVGVDHEKQVIDRMTARPATENGESWPLSEPGRSPETRIKSAPPSGRAIDETLAISPL
jgi:hypothetical protein